MQTPKKIGLTGGIASGKSTAQRLFETLDVVTLDHDILAREAVAKNSQGLTELTTLFGTDILDEELSLDRTKLKTIIFNDSRAKKQVEDIVHPLVFAASEAIIAQHKSEPYIMIVSPLLIESGSAKNMFKLVVVDLPHELQLKRLLGRDGMSEDLALSIIKSQATPAQRQAAADFLLDNSADVEHLQQQVETCHAALLQLINATA